MAESVKRVNCPICMDSMNGIAGPNNVPKLLPCVHSVCYGCLNDLIRHGNGREFSCPVCRVPTQVPWNGADGFNTNIYLIPDSEPQVPSRRADNVVQPQTVCSFCTSELEDGQVKSFVCGHDLCLTCSFSTLDCQEGDIVCPVCFKTACSFCTTNVDEGQLTSFVCGHGLCNPCSVSALDSAEGIRVCPVCLTTDATFHSDVRIPQSHSELNYQTYSDVSVAQSEYLVELNAAFQQQTSTEIYRRRPTLFRACSFCTTNVDEGQLTSFVCGHGLCNPCSVSALDSAEGIRVCPVCLTTDATFHSDVRLPQSHSELNYQTYSDVLVTQREYRVELNVAFQQQTSTEIYRRRPTLFRSTSDCSFCMDTLVTSSSHVLLCGHTICQYCKTGSNLSRKPCPVCRHR